MSGPNALIWAVCILFLSAFVAGVNAGQTTQQQDPPWKWPYSKIAEAVNKVRSGRDLTPRSWPGNTRIAVGLSFDFDNETVSLRDGQTSPALMALGEYGARAGLPRILRLLDQAQIPATFFIPAVSARLHPDSVKDILASKRHESESTAGFTSATASFWRPRSAS